MPFTIPANDYIDNPISIDTYLVRDRTSSYLLRVEGDAMRRSAICDGDLVLVETALPLRDGTIVVACLEGEFILRRYLFPPGSAPRLLSENPTDPEITVKDGDDFTIFGTVTAVIRKLRA